MLTGSEAFITAPHSGPLGWRHALWHAPLDRPPRALVVHVHAFAEEMNKARRMVALQSRALAGAGFAVLQMDLLGCGDSAGDFGDATWRAWVDDVGHACALGAARVHQAWPDAAPPALWLWGLRAGGLLALAGAAARPAPCHFLFWQPQSSGKQALQQFLRLKLAASLDADAKTVSGQLHRDLDAGRSVDVAGYTLSSALAAGLSGAVLAPPPADHAPGRCVWIETSGRDDARPTPATSAAMARWQDAGWAVEGHVAAGRPFWSTVEVEEAPALIERTTAALADGGVG